MKGIPGWFVAMLVAGCLVGGSVPAHAGFLQCFSAEVTHVWVYPRIGSVIVTVDLPYIANVQSEVKGASWGVCSLTTQVGAVKPEMCSELYNELLFAKGTGTTVQFGFLDSLKKADGTPVQSCGEVPVFNTSLVTPYIEWVRLDR